MQDMGLISILLKHTVKKNNETIRDFEHTAFWMILRSC